MMETKLKAGTTLIVDLYSFSGVPDLVLYLDIPPEKAAERGGYGGGRYEHLEFQKKVAQCFQILCDPSWKIIDACQAMEDVEKKLQETALDPVITCRKGKPLFLLWRS